MELTPIIIPGKRRRQGEPALTANPKKRARKPETDPTKRKSKKMIFKPKASYLEKELPLEIIENIFWQSENINFLRASPRVGCLLSGVSTRRETFLQAFGPTWDVWFGCIRTGTGQQRGIQSYAGWEFDSSRFGGNPEFQSDLLQYAWVDVSFILECWDLWVCHYGQDRYFQHAKFWDNNPLLSPPHPETVTEDDDADSERATRPAKDYFLHDYNAFCSQARSGLAIFSGNDKNWIEVHEATQIPNQLLSGPWDEAAQQKLFWLVRAGVRLSADQTWETTLEGYQNAMNCEGGREPNMVALRLLYILGSFAGWPQYIATAELYKLADRGRYSGELDAQTRNIMVMLQDPPNSWRTAHMQVEQ